MGLTMKNFTKIKDPPLKSTIVLLPYSRRNPQFLHLIILLKNFISPQTGGTDVKINAIAHTVCCRKNLFLGSTSSEPTAVV